MIPFQTPINMRQCRAVYLHGAIPVPKEAPCYIVYGASKEYSAKGSFGLSLKTVRSGNILFECGGGAHLVTPDSYLVINQGQEYKVSIKTSQPTQPVSFFYSKPFLNDVMASWATSYEQALDGDLAQNLKEQAFYEKLYFDPTMLQALKTFFMRFDDLRDDSEWLREQSAALLARLLSVHLDTVREVNGLHLARESTREEIYRRLHKARDYALANLHEPVTLDELANVACFSPSYFMRTFKSVFGTTPYQYIVQHRLERAKRLLVNTDMPIGEVCLAVGFQSFGAFSWFFSKKTGLCPERYRKAQREQVLLAG